MTRDRHTVRAATGKPARPVPCAPYVPPTGLASALDHRPENGKYQPDWPSVSHMQSYTIGQAARLLGVSADTVRRWADA
ncbi:hypothetical protein ACFWIP_20080, partial [Streptomyces anulatus]